MGVGDLLVLLWLLSAARHTKQELTLRSSAQVMTTCGHRVTLYCNVSSSMDGLSVKHLSWKHKNKTLCHVTNDELTNDHNGACRYDVQSLSLNFLQTVPQESEVPDEYACIMRSNQGFGSEKASVKLKECYRDVEVHVTAEGLNCTITGVYPDGDMHWFQDATRLTESNATIQIRKHVDKGGYLTIIGFLQVKDHTGLYKCSLWNTESKTYTASKDAPRTKTETLEPGMFSRSGSEPQRLQWRILSFFIISVLLVTL